MLHGAGSLRIAYAVGPPLEVLWKKLDQTSEFLWRDTRATDGRPPLKLLFFLFLLLLLILLLLLLPSIELGPQGALLVLEQVVFQSGLCVHFFYHFFPPPKLFTGQLGSCLKLG